jgi:hypothetical protein
MSEDATNRNHFLNFFSDSKPACLGRVAGDSLGRAGHSMVDRIGVASWSIALESDEHSSIHVGGRIQFRWAVNGENTSSARRDFVALYEHGQPVRKYVDYKMIEKDGLLEGHSEFVAPQKPGLYFLRYLRADYSELAASHPFPVKSALSALLDSVKAHSMRGEPEAVVELLEMMMLQLKPNDEAFHRQALDRWRELQRRNIEQTQQTCDPESQNLSSELSQGGRMQSDLFGAVSQETDEVQASQIESTCGAESCGSRQSTRKRQRGLTKLRIRGTGYNELRGVWLGSRSLVQGEKGSTKKQAGLHLLVNAF